MKKLTAAWVMKAEADFVAAGQLARGKIPLHDQVCFHCQQSAEKYLKALLAELGQPIPPTHILADLLGLLLPHHGSLRPFERGLRFLTRFAVGFRYPGLTATKRQALSALRWAERVRAACRSLLSLPPGRPRRKESP
jgi:HEPN domain-containing protein